MRRRRPRYYFRIEGPWRKNYLVKSRFSAVPFPEVSFQSFRGRNISLLVFDFPLLIGSGRRRILPLVGPFALIFSPPWPSILSSCHPRPYSGCEGQAKKEEGGREGGGKVGFILGEGGGCSCPSFQDAWENMTEGGCLARSKDRPIVEKRLLPQNALLMSFFPFFLPAKNGWGGGKENAGKEKLRRWKL